MTSLEDLVGWTPTIGPGSDSLGFTFYGSGIVSLRGIENFNVSNADALIYTFANCSSLKTLGGIDADNSNYAYGLAGWKTKTGNIRRYNSTWRNDTALEDVSALADWEVPHTLTVDDYITTGVPRTATGYWDVPGSLRTN